MNENEKKIYIYPAYFALWKYSFIFLFFVVFSGMHNYNNYVKKKKKLRSILYQVYYPMFQAWDSVIHSAYLGYLIGLYAVFLDDFRWPVDMTTRVRSHCSPLKWLQIALAVLSDQYFVYMLSYTTLQNHITFGSPL